jgi:hypothetical protein
VRLSLGGSRVRIIRQLLVDSVALAYTAAALGLAMALVVPQAYCVVSRKTRCIAPPRTGTCWRIRERWQSYRAWYSVWHRRCTPRVLESRRH